MDRYEKYSLVALFIAYKVIIIFIYYVHIALYHCPKAKNVKQGEGKEENQTGNFHPV